MSLSSLPCHSIPRLMTLFDSKDAVMDNFHFFVVLQELSSLLSMEAMSFVTEDRKTVQESSFPNTYTFDLFGGVDVSSVRACFGVLFPRHAFSLVVRSPFLFSEPREYVLKFSILPPYPLCPRRPKSCWWKFWCDPPSRHWRRNPRVSKIALSLIKKKACWLSKAAVMLLWLMACAAGSSLFVTQKYSDWIEWFILSPRYLWMIAQCVVLLASRASCSVTRGESG